MFDTVYMEQKYERNELISAAFAFSANFLMPSHFIEHLSLDNLKQLWCR